MRENCKEDTIVKYTIKDSVFSDLFKSKKYLMQLYWGLHPEDKTATEDLLTDVTIKNVLTDGIYNDLGFLLGEKYMILLEAQSLWTPNIIIRELLYLAQTCHEYFEHTNQNLYKSKKAKMPKPELYVVYTGEQKNIPETLSLSEEFFGGADVSVDIKVQVICENDTDSIINQYIIFCKIYNEQMKLYGRTRKTITETIRICRNQDILKEYLESREKEVVSIMMSLFDEEEVMRSYIKSERQEAAREAEQNKVKEKAKLMLIEGRISLNEMQTFFPELSDVEIEEIKTEILQLI